MKTALVSFLLLGTLALSAQQTQPAQTPAKQAPQKTLPTQQALTPERTGQIPAIKLSAQTPPAQQLSGGQTNSATRRSPGGSALIFDTLPNDPYKARIYTLSNGLKVYLSVNKEAPRIQTYIAVKAGSKFDPPQTTGLAHYLEHMVFKGSHDYGTLNWAKESVLLDTLSAWFEYHKNEKDESRKKEWYSRIDSLSYEASKLAVPNEYDKMTTSLGAKGTNAFTSTDMTVYVNDIPSNALDKFLQLEANRFQTLVLRLFHTELEAVYEEFNISQDNDRRWSDHEVMNALLPNHPYGTQTTIGEGEHLKNPSMVNIHNYFDTYYRPNNVAIVMAGDLDPDKTIALIEKYFGKWQKGVIPEFIKKAEPEIASPVEREYKGAQPEHVLLGYRFDGANSKEALMVKLIDMILSNGNAGLIDLDLVQQQKLLRAGAYPDDNTDYVIHKFYGEPKQGQTLEQVKDLLLAEVEKVKKGEFGDWVLPAIIQNMKLERMRNAETNAGRAGDMMGTFVHNIPWEQYVNELNELSKITKADVVRFANEHYKSNYAYCYKRTGDAVVHKVEKPKITPVVMNKDTNSAFKIKWDMEDQKPITPRFIDFRKDITHLKLTKAEVPFDYIKNDINKTFSLNYIYDMGTDNIRELGLAINYLPYLGTSKYTAEQLKTEFYKLGLSFNVNAGRDRVYVTLSGLEENLEKGITLFEHVLANVRPDKEVYEQLVMDMMQSRQNAKKNKGTILSGGLVNYAKYGPVNPFNNVMTTEDLNKVDINKLVELIKSLSTYKHTIFYYGQRSAASALATVNQLHVVNGLKAYPPAKQYPELPLNETKVYVAYFPMKQAEIVLMSKDGLFDKALYPSVFLYNDYYGAGLSSIMFQELRERMALAYSVYSRYNVPQYSNESHYITSYIGTQVDKLDTALVEISKLLNNMPVVPQQFEGARQSVIKTLESDWVTGADIYWAWDRAKKRGLTYDVRKDVYEKASAYTITDMYNFFTQHVKGKKTTYLVIGKKEDLNMEALKKLGPVQEVELKDLFGY